jgi:nitrous oxide reductase
MKHLIPWCAAAGALILLAAGCGSQSAPEPAPQAMGEYVPGYKRLAGTFERQTDFSRKPVVDIGKPDVTIEVTAAIAGFEPKEIRVTQNQVVELVLVGVDNGQLPAVTAVDKFTGHGFHMSSYDIWVGGLRAGVERRIKFRATRAGKFFFECPVFCSLEHYKMNGKFIVDPAH